MSLQKWRLTLTVLVRVVGLALVLWNTNALASVVVRMVAQSAFAGRQPSTMSLTAAAIAASVPIGMAVLGAYMFLSGRWFVGRLLKGLARGCSHCGYDTRGLRSGFCPECGTDLAES
ncbi:MAG: zinc ribbon domain-containing protein [Planctomycetota bacterium]